MVHASIGGRNAINSKESKKHLDRQCLEAF